jgi:biotin operon repressor
MKISDFLNNGESEAVSLETLSISTGLPERAVKKAVLQARLNGELILSSDNGYFLPSDSDEIKAYVCKRKGYLKTAHAALRPFIKAIR